MFTSSLLLLPTLALSALAAPSLNAASGRAAANLIVRDDLPAVCTVNASGGDDVPALLAALASCKEIVVPVDQNLSIRSKLNATGLSDTHVHFYGNLTIWPDVEYWNQPENVFNVTYQENSAAIFFGGRNVVLDGGGTFDGNGQTFYDARIANDSLKPPFFFVVYEADGLRVDNIHFRQSPRWTTIIHSSKNVIFSHLSMISRSNTRARGRESNRETDGVDIYNSDQVIIHDIHYDAGDDCLSFKPNATNIFVSNIWCNGSHGVSVGSLGEYAGVKDVVENIFVSNVTIQNSENGARLKAWGGENRGYGYVNNIYFTDFKHDNNDAPMSLDSCYKTNPENCTANPSEIEISNVYFTNHHDAPGKHAASGKFGNVVAAFSSSPGMSKNFFVDSSSDLTTIPSCGVSLYANINLNILGTDSQLFVNGADIHGAGGVLQNNATPIGKTCEELGLVPLAAAA